MKTLVSGFRFQVSVLMVCAGLALFPAAPARAWDHVINDQDFSGDVILERGIFVGPQNSYRYKLPLSMSTNAQTNAVMVVSNLTVYGAFTVGTTDFVTSASSATVGLLTVQTNAAVGGTLGVTGALSLAATQTIFTAAAVANTNAAVPEQGLAVTVNGTNYVIKLYPRSGP